MFIRQRYEIKWNKHAFLGRLTKTRLKVWEFRFFVVILRPKVNIDINF